MVVNLFCKKHWPVLVSTVFILQCCFVVLVWNQKPMCHCDGVEPKAKSQCATVMVWSQKPKANVPLVSNHPPNVLADRRTDIVPVTPWLAPIVWDETFDPMLLDALYEPRNITVAMTVFAVGKYTRFLRDLLETAEHHFFVGFNVRYFVFTDRPDEVPSVKLGAGRELVVKTVPGSNRWQEISAGRMNRIQDLIETELRGHADYIFCLDVDAKFHGRWGTETLGELVAVLHPAFYTRELEFTYERRPASKAHMAPYEGDYYYGGAVFGGKLTYVHHLVSTCSHNFELDAKQGIEALWQEESHLNKYLWLHKPTKVLSPEYLWLDSPEKWKAPEIRIIRYSSVVKDKAEVRPNV